MEIVQKLTTFISTNANLIGGISLGAIISTALQQLFKEKIKDYIEDGRRKRKEKILLSDHILEWCSSVDVEKLTEKKHVLTEYWVLANKVKGYDENLGQLVIIWFNQASGFGKLYMELSEKFKKKITVTRVEMEGFTRQGEAMDKTRNEIILRAHILRGTKPFWVKHILNFKKVARLLLIFLINSKEKIVSSSTRIATVAKGKSH